MLIIVVNFKHDGDFLGVWGMLAFIYGPEILCLYFLLSFSVFSSLRTNFFEPFKPKQGSGRLAQGHESVFLQGGSLDCMLKYVCVLLLVLR